MISSFRHRTNPGISRYLYYKMFFVICNLRSRWDCRFYPEWTIRIIRIIHCSRTFEYPIEDTTHIEHNKSLIWCILDTWTALKRGKVSQLATRDPIHWNEWGGVRPLLWLMVSLGIAIWCPGISNVDIGQYKLTTFEKLLAQSRRSCLISKYH